MKAISLWQPWASAVSLGLKVNETRHWSTNHRGQIAIHAARKDTRKLRDTWDHFMCRGEFAQPFQNARLYSFTMLPKGAVVAVAELVEVVPVGMIMANRLVRGLEWELGDYSTGRFIWRLKNIQMLALPYHIAGRQGLFDVPDKLN